MSAPDEKRIREVVRDVVERHLASAPAAPPRSTSAAVRRVAVGSDHGGFALKQIIASFVRDELGWEVEDCGTHSTDAVDYPDFAAAVARAVASGRCSRGVVVDAAGIGSTMAANKVAG